MQRHDSIEGDGGIRTISFVLHGNSSRLDCERILESGLVMQEGRATVSTDFAHALRWATSPEKRQYSRSSTQRKDNETGRIFIIMVPKNLHIGYGIHTSMVVDAQYKEIKGAPTKFASGRKQLAFYKDENTEEARQNLEINRVEKTMTIGSEMIIAAIHPTEALHQCITELENRVRRFEEPKTTETLTRLRQIIHKNGSIIKDVVLLDEALVQLVQMTVESILISRVRNLSLDAKRVLGYKMILEDGSYDAKEVNPEMITRQTQRLQHAIQSGVFRSEPDWLIKYLTLQIQEMSF